METRSWWPRTDGEDFNLKNKVGTTVEYRGARWITENPAYWTSTKTLVKLKCLDEPVNVLDITIPERYFCHNCLRWTALHIGTYICDHCEGLCWEAVCIKHGTFSNPVTEAIEVSKPACLEEVLRMTECPEFTDASIKYKCPWCFSATYS